LYVGTVTLRRLYVLFFIDLERRKVFLAGVPANPVEAGVTNKPATWQSQTGSAAWSTITASLLVPHSLRQRRASARSVVWCLVRCSVLASPDELAALG
jgi:hypothetical protein